MLIKRDEYTKKETVIDDTPEKMEEISRFNGFLTSEEVNRILSLGKRVYTTFSSYIRTVVWEGK